MSINQEEKMLEYIVGSLVLWEIYRLFNVDNIISVKKFLGLTKEKREDVKTNNPDFYRKSEQLTFFGMLAAVTYLSLLVYSLFAGLALLFWTVAIILIFRLIMNALRKAFHQSPAQQIMSLKTRLYCDAGVSLFLLTRILLLILGVF